MTDRYTENEKIIEARLFLDNNEEKLTKNFLGKIFFKFYRKSLTGTRQWAIFVAEAILDNKSKLK